MDYEEENKKMKDQIAALERENKKLKSDAMWDWEYSRQEEQAERGRQGTFI